MKKFYCIRNKDSADEYIAALVGAGYEVIPTMDLADFMLIDCEHAGRKRAGIFEFANKKPVFIYPHTPYSYWLWDGVYQAASVACNFVVGEGAIQAMKAYGYPYRAEAVGWTGCDTRPFVPRTGTRLLFAPPHLLGNSKYAMHKDVFPIIQQTAKFIADNHREFESILVSHSWQGVEASGVEILSNIKNVKFQSFNAYKTEAPRKHALSQIAQADLVISANTLAYLAIAQGVPTIMFGNDLLGTYRVRNYDRYRDIYEYPLNLEYMGIEAVLNARHKLGYNMERWKELNIGKPFDAEKFISVVKEYV